MYCTGKKNRLATKQRLKIIFPLQKRVHFLKFGIFWLKLNERCKKIICYCSYVFFCSFNFFLHFFFDGFQQQLAQRFHFCKAAFWAILSFAFVCIRLFVGFMIWCLNAELWSSKQFLQRKQDTNTGSFDVNSFRYWNVLWCGTNSISDAFVVTDMFVVKMTETCKSTMVTNSELVGLGSKQQLLFERIIVLNGRSNKCAVLRLFLTHKQTR